MNVEVRHYRDGDGAATLEVFQRAIRLTAAEHYNAEQIAAWAPEHVDLDRWGSRRAQAWTVVAEIDDRIVGFSDLTDDGVLDMLFVHPDFSRRAVVQALVQAVLNEASARGVARVETHASRAARAVFERIGFIVDAENRHNSVNGIVVPNFDMHIDMADSGVMDGIQELRRNNQRHHAKEHA